MARGLPFKASRRMCLRCEPIVVLWVMELGRYAACLCHCRLNDKSPAGMLVQAVVALAVV